MGGKSEALLTPQMEPYSGPTSAFQLTSDAVICRVKWLCCWREKEREGMCVRGGNERKKDYEIEKELKSTALSCQRG